jgi:CRP-like cAMP-binding protein
VRFLASRTRSDLLVEQASPGTMFGASVMLGEKYMVTAQCVTNSKIMAIGKTALEQVVNSNPQMGLVSQRYVAEFV